MEQILNKGVRRTKSVKLALERLLPFISDLETNVTKVPRYEGNGYWSDYSPLTDNWYPRRTVKVFVQNAWLVVNWHPDPEAVKDAIRWKGDPHALERQVKVHHQDMRALKWLSMDPRWDDWGIEKVEINPDFQDPAKQEKYRSRYHARVQKTLEELG